MNRIRMWLLDIWEVTTMEIRRVFSNKMTLLVFYVAPLLYPLIFAAIYSKEVVNDVPVAVIDEKPSTMTRRIIRKLDATPEIRVDYRCDNMREAEQLMRDHKIHAIYLIPRDFTQSVEHMETGHIELFCDMSTFLYYKSVATGASSVQVDELHTIEEERYAAAGITGETAEAMVKPVVYDDIKLFNPSGGFSSFFIQALLMVVIHQTLFFGIGILCGEANEDRKALHYIPKRLRNKSLHRVTFGRALCYMLLYIPVTGYVLWIVPHWFRLPQLGTVYDLVMFLLPFMLAVIFFAQTFGNFFVRQKTTIMLCCLCFSVVLFFLSGVVWPQSNMPRFWLAFSYIFPSTPGIQGFVHIASTGASLAEVRSEYMALWIQAAFYFVFSIYSLRYIRWHEKI